MKDEELLDKMKKVFLKRMKNQDLATEIPEKEVCEEICKKVITGPAYIDFTPRTLKGIKKTDIENAVLNPLTNEIFKCIENGPNNQVEFDEWHEKTCVLFQNKFKEETKKEIKAGKAQKIVNMTFKYMYCCKNASGKDVFKYCHMPLDTYILEWFCDECIEDKLDISKTQIKETSWSNLEYGEPDKVYSYLWIQNIIRNGLKSSDRTLLEAEFFIWPEQQMRKAIKNIKDQMFLDEEYPDYSVNLGVDENVHERIKRLSDYISKTQGEK